MPMQRSKGSGGEEAVRREAEEAEQYELARGIRRTKGRIDQVEKPFAASTTDLPGAPL